MADSFELPDETERIQINLEDDVRSFLLAHLSGNQMDPKKKAQLAEMGVDVRRLSRPSYIAINSGVDGTSEDGSARGCRVGAEGYMIHEDEAAIHLAFKCGVADHDMHYTSFMPVSVIEMAKAMEAVWPGSVMGHLIHQAVKLGRATTRPPDPSYFMSGEVEEDETEALEGLEAEDEEEEDDDLFI